jgi:hypothetical protein
VPATSLSQSPLLQVRRPHIGSHVPVHSQSHLPHFSSLFFFRSCFYSLAKREAMVDMNGDRTRTHTHTRVSARSEYTGAQAIQSLSHSAMKQ